MIRQPWTHLAQCEETTVETLGCQREHRCSSDTNIMTSDIMNSDSMTSDIMPHVRCLVKECAKSSRQYFRFYVHEENEDSLEVLDCDPSDALETSDVTSEGFLIKDAYFEDRDMEHLEFVYEPSFLKETNSISKSLPMPSLQCRNCSKNKLSEKIDGNKVDFEGTEC